MLLWKVEVIYYEELTMIRRKVYLERLTDVSTNYEEQRTALLLASKRVYDETQPIWSNLNDGKGVLTMRIFYSPD